MTNAKNVICLNVAMLMCSVIAAAQSDDCMKVLAKKESMFYQHVVNNVIFKIIHERYKCSEVEESEFRYLLPDVGSSYVIRFQCSEITFPDPDYILYEYYMEKFLTPSEPDSLGRVRWTTKFGVHFNAPINKGLVLYNVANENYLIVSGYAFLDPISHFYFRDGFDSSSLISYCKVRYFNYRPIIENFSVKEKWVEFYSEAMDDYYRADLSEDRIGPELRLKE